MVGACMLRSLGCASDSGAVLLCFAAGGVANYTACASCTSDGASCIRQAGPQVPVVCMVVQGHVWCVRALKQALIYVH
jgi:hypothetical protein